MENYKECYYLLFTGISELIEHLEAIILDLKNIQMDAEETFISQA